MSKACEEYEYKRRGTIIGFTYPYGQVQIVVAYRYDLQTETGLFACKTIPFLEGPIPSGIFSMLQGEMARAKSQTANVETIQSHSQDNASDWSITLRNRIVGNFSLVRFMRWPVVDILYKRVNDVLLTRVQQLGHGEDIWCFRDNDIDTLYALERENISDPPQSWLVRDEFTC